MNTGRNITTILGRSPPGQGDSPRILSIGAPTISRNSRDWDTVEETLWVEDLNAAQLVDGFDRSIPLRLAGYITMSGVMRVTGYKVTGMKAGCPVITLTSKGWVRTKADTWAKRRNTTGDTVQNLVLGGFAYAARTYYGTSIPVGDYTAKAAPTDTWDIGAAVIAPIYMTSWPYFFTGVTPGWFLSSREVETIPGTSVSRTVDTFTALMNNDGTAF